MKIIKALFITTALFSITATAHAALYDRGNGMIYDSTLNVTWLQDANYQHTYDWPSGSYNVMPTTWSQATAWAAQLDYNGITGWRLPSARLMSTGNICYANDGTCDIGYNNTTSELGSLYVELGNTPGINKAGVAQPFSPLISTFIDAGTGKTDSFLHLEDGVYLEAEAPPGNSGSVWEFFLNESGYQGYGPNSGPADAWAVHDGDVAAVPIPATAWLFGSSLIGLASTARRRQP